ncbi:MAG TPA: glycosyltransferase family 4 protein [Verrucomicrobiae bacterium]
MKPDSQLRVVHVFPDPARLSCGPCNAIKAFMACQLEHGLDVLGLSQPGEGISADHTAAASELPILEATLDQLPGLAREQVLAGRTVFHFHGFYPWTDALARQLHQAKVPYVFTSHGQLHFHSPLHAFKKWVYLNLLNPFLRRAGGVHFLTQREQGRSRFILPAWRKPVLVQPNLAYLANGKAIPATSRQLLDLPAEAFVFGYLGRLDIQHKGLDILMSAFAQVVRQVPARLIFIGPDVAAGQERLLAQAQALGCAAQVKFLGSQVGAAKWGYLKMLDGFVSPSRWEACSIAQAEAIGLGVPTIVSREINLAGEMAAQGAALVADLETSALANAMLRLAREPALRQNLTQAGAAWVDHEFSPVNAGPRFVKFYRSVLANAGP